MERVIAGSMVGRAAELSELVQAWSRAADPAASSRRVQTVVVTGSAGVGKSLLVASALEQLVPRPVVVLSGTARVHAPSPYDWLAAVLSGRDLSGVPVPAGALAWFAQDPDAPVERYAPGAMLRLAVRAVRALLGTGPGVLVVEDLHALDPASLNLIGELATATDLPALLLVTSRPADDAVSPRLAARTLARLTSVPGAVRQHLNPLPVEAVESIMAQVCPVASRSADAVRVVWERTGGNPYLITELLATTGAAGLAALGGEDTMRSARDLTLRERDVLRCLAEGMSNKQVARSLGISVRTVTVHVSNLLRKTRSSSRTEAALWAVRHRMAAPERGA